jgi:hypothetical protein
MATIFGNCCRPWPAYHYTPMFQDEWFWSRLPDIPWLCLQIYSISDDSSTLSSQSVEEDVCSREFMAFAFAKPAILYHYWSNLWAQPEATDRKKVCLQNAILVVSGWYPTSAKDIFILSMKTKYHLMCQVRWRPVQKPTRDPPVRWSCLSSWCWKPRTPVPEHDARSHGQHKQAQYRESKWNWRWWCRQSEEDGRDTRPTATTSTTGIHTKSTTPRRKPKNKVKHPTKKGISNNWAGESPRKEQYEQIK